MKPEIVRKALELKYNVVEGSLVVSEDTFVFTTFNGETFDESSLSQADLTNAEKSIEKESLLRIEAKMALLEKLGITEDEAKLLLS